MRIFFKFWQDYGIGRGRKPSIASQRVRGQCLLSMNGEKFCKKINKGRRGVKDIWEVTNKTNPDRAPTDWENISLFAWVEGMISEENTAWSWYPWVIVKVHFEGRIWVPEIAQNTSTPFTVRRSEDLEVNHMSWQLHQLETSPEPTVEDSGYRRNLNEILYPALTMHISR